MNANQPKSRMCTIYSPNGNSTTYLMRNVFAVEQNEDRKDSACLETHPMATARRGNNPQKISENPLQPTSSDPQNGESALTLSTPLNSKHR